MPQYPWNTPLGSNYKHVAGAGTTVVRSSGSGILQGMIVNSVGGTATLGVSFYDTPVSSGVGSSTLIAGAVPVTSAVIPFGLEYGLTYNTGLAVVTAGATVDITVVYK